MWSARAASTAEDQAHLHLTASERHEMSAAERRNEIVQATAFARFATADFKVVRAFSAWRGLSIPAARSIRWRGAMRYENQEP